MDAHGIGFTTSCKTALVTGGSQGIGRGAALALARLGCNVIVNYRSNASAAAEVVAAVTNMGRRAIALQADVADFDQVERMVSDGEAALGPIDALVVNAAYSIRKPFVEYTTEEIATTLNVSLHGAIHASLAVGRRMVERRKGRVVFISSLHAEKPFADCAAYNIAKAGMQHLALSLATEWIPYRINVNAIQPGWVDTPGERRMFGHEAVEVEGPSRVPWGRMGTVDELGEAVCYLCSDQAEYMTGSILRIDGGFALPRARPSDDTTAGGSGPTYME